MGSWFFLLGQKIIGANKIGAAISGPRIAGGKITDMRLFSGFLRPILGHCTEITITHKKITEPKLYYFRIIFGNSCSVITEPICFWN